MYIFAAPLRCGAHPFEIEGSKAASGRVSPSFTATLLCGEALRRRRSLWDETLGIGSLTLMYSALLHCWEDRTC